MTTYNPAYIIADHIKTTCFMIADGVQPSGKQRGYILRRLIRISFSASLKLNIDITKPEYYAELIDTVIEIYKGVYVEIEQHRDRILEIINSEAVKYQKAISVGEKEWTKILK